MNALDGLKVLGAYLAGAAMALAIVMLFDSQPLGSGLSIMMLNTSSLFASGVLTRTRRAGELVLFSVTVLSVLGVALVCAVHATVGWKDGVAAPLAFALANAVLLPWAQARGARRRTLPGALLERPVGQR